VILGGGAEEVQEEEVEEGTQALQGTRASDSRTLTSFPLRFCEVVHFLLRRSS
jgi:hypothetical protein